MLRQHRRAPARLCREYAFFLALALSGAFMYGGVTMSFWVHAFLNDPLETIWFPLQSVECTISCLLALQCPSICGASSEMTRSCSSLRAQPGLKLWGCPYCKVLPWPTNFQAGIPPAFDWLYITGPHLTMQG